MANAGFENPHGEFDQIHQFLLECHRLQWDATFTIRAIPNINVQATEHLILQLRSCREILVGLDDPFTTEAEKEHLVNVINDVLRPLQDFVDRYPAAQAASAPEPTIPRVFTGKRGRPGYNLDLERALYLHSIGNSWADVAAAMGVVRQTMYNHLDRVGLSASRPAHTVISDDDLDEKIAQISLLHPFDGARMVEGHLKSRGIFVAFLRIQDSLRRVDPLGVFTRWAGLLRRRVYHVRGSNALWHMDGNEKLRMWGFYVHGCVDGHSRLIIYMQCRSNKRGDTVKLCFERAVEKYGWPSRMRGDYGTENNEVERLMIEHWGMEHNAYLRGLSMHNIRMERSWRDARKGVLETFRQIFFHLESLGCLERENKLHRTCLHLTFRHRIQAALDRHVSAWNRHSMRTEGNRSPVAQYELSKTHAIRQGWWTGDVGDAAEDAADPYYGIDGQAPQPPPEEETAEYNDEDDVQEEMLEAARLLLPDVDFHEDDGNWGMNVYMHAVDLLMARLEEEEEE